MQAPAISVSVPEKAPPAAVTTPVPTSAPVVQAKPVAPPVPTQAPVVRAAQPHCTRRPPARSDAAQAPATTLVQAIVDAYHISGVRLSGAGSKALVDGRVYKLNDIVDKALGLKLVKVDEDHLTFVDRDGATFVRNF